MSAPEAVESREELAREVARFELLDVVNLIMDGLRDGLDRPTILDHVRARIALITEVDPAAVCVVTLAEILANPDALKPPEPVVERLAWRGRATLLAAREKRGKSTFLSAAVAALTRGHRFLGMKPETGTALYLPLEEHTSDFARRMVEFGADPERVLVMERVHSPLAELEAAVKQHQPDLVIVDTLGALVESLGLDIGKSTEWRPVMGRLVRIARDYDAAMVVATHTDKGEKDFANSYEIGAVVDQIMLLKAGEVAGTRLVEAERGRWKVDSYAVRYVEGSDGLPSYFELAAGDLGLDARVLVFVEHNPRASKRAIRDGVRGKASEIDNAIHRLLSQRAIVDDGEGGRCSFRVPDPKTAGVAA